MSKDNHQEIKRFGFLQIAVLVLSIYVLFAVLAQTLFRLRPEVNALLDRIDFFVCLVFLAEFVISFRRAPSKLAFMKWGWIDLLSSIPLWDLLRWGRVVRIVRIVRLLRAFRSTKNLLVFLYRDRTRGAIATAALTAGLVMIFASIAVLTFENDAESNIKSPFDAVWWAVSTVTTVGYGDKVPVTLEGKIVAMILMLFGIGLFGVLTGLFARLLVVPDFKSEESEIANLATEVRLLRERIEEMERTSRRGSESED